MVSLSWYVRSTVSRRDSCLSCIVPDRRLASRCLQCDGGIILYDTGAFQCAYQSISLTSHTGSSAHCVSTITPRVELRLMQVQFFMRRRDARESKLCYFAMHAGSDIVTQIARSGLLEARNVHVDVRRAENCQECVSPILELQQRVAVLPQRPRISRRKVRYSQIQNGLAS